MSLSTQPAAFAADPAKSRGRRWPEAESRTRSAFERDRDRIIHSTAFRRLKGKTQVFVAHEGDHFRTRLTHSLEVAQIARSVSRRLGLNEDLAETCALAHDLGHPPFGHTGEQVLDQCMKPWGGFDHNAQTLRVLTRLERRYPHFDGLNLTWETLEGTVKHNGPMLRAGDRLEDLAPVWRDLNAEFDMGLTSFASAEAQIAAVADDIAYNNHDIDDALSGGIFTDAELCDGVPMVRDVFDAVRHDFPDLDRDRRRGEVIRRLIGIWVNDLVSESQRRISLYKPGSVDEVRQLPQALVGFSDEMLAKAAELRQFLFAKMYRHWRMNRSRSQARRIVRELFDVFLAEPDTLPPDWQDLHNKDSSKAARLVCDYIAGMTDDFAIDEHRRLFNLDRTL
ncbi:deoxyguanosinetriphosphate triphosphohydrolase-like protein [Candidatus Phycosocius bacilliformis]|uniref:Deoxyguanosinetriphosphate triphosphohydrolase-like protein n=1 Tax=Candidatus Phycosocius bacilliformis TaxID=1445552 RepID=A0A2P2EAQ7_9PROT|nr:deoxyguanosinetriphosphate triphosphohydrolase [Candidatus Phycosocius bacilliformis]GBF58132.1 deoxyguanosinetriphosphate triphosphohydrolase-like protein [Candidatus Phycosocius bacilliformis]